MRTFCAMHACSICLYWLKPYWQKTPYFWWIASTKLATSTKAAEASLYRLSSQHEDFLAEVEVAFDIDDNGIMNVSTKDKTGKQTTRPNFI